MKKQGSSPNRKLHKLAPLIAQGLIFGLTISFCVLFCLPSTLIGTAEIMTSMSMTERLLAMAVFIGIVSTVCTSVFIFTILGKFRQRKSKSKVTALSNLPLNIKSTTQYVITDDGEVLEVMENKHSVSSDETSKR